MTNVKICGLQPGDNLTFGDDPMVSHLGVIFVPTSKRYVDPTAARVMLENGPATCQVMGVFTDADTGTVLSALEASGADGAQLHGRESREDCEAIREQGYIVWKSFSAPLTIADPETFIEALVLAVKHYAGAMDAILLDAAPPKNAPVGMTGGHGQRFDWSYLPTCLSAIRAVSEVPVWIAGGLTPENVIELLTVCRPDGIDVSSGVEVNGRKSMERIQDMMKAVGNHG